MELYRGRPNVVEFEAPITGVPVTASWTLNGLPQTTVGTTEVETGLWQMQLPYIPSEGIAKITWTFGINSVTDVYEVVTPYLSHRWIKRNLMQNATDFEVEQAEMAARHIINTFTGQSFGQKREVKRIRGNGQGSLKLPERLINLYSIQQVGYPVYYYDVTNHITDDPEYFLGMNQFRIDGDGWFISKLAYVDAMSDDISLTVTGPIFNPFRTRYGAWSANREFLVDGDWGWDGVPQPVVEAAKLLVNDYACSESQYRDNYLESIKSADWRLQFNAGAYSGTGNVRADQLLRPFQAFGGWAVL